MGVRRAQPLEVMVEGYVREFDGAKEPRMRMQRRTGRKIRLSRWIAACAVLAMVLAACGNGEEVADDPDDVEGPAEEPDEPEAPDDAEEPEEPADDDADEFAEAREFYEGNTVTFAVGSSPGGGYDTYMRTIAPYLEEELGATVVPENQTGAGGLLMTNDLWREEEGLTISIINGIGMAGVALGEGEGVEFDLGGLQYVAMVSQDPPVLAAEGNSPYQSLDDVLGASGLILGATGVQSGANINAQAFINMFGLDDFSVATAFDGSSEVELALLAGDVDLMFGSLETRIPSVEAGETVALMGFAEEAPEELPDLIVMDDLREMLDGEALEVLEAHFAMTGFHRPVAMGPNVPQERVAYVEEAFRNVLNNPDYLADVEAAGLAAAYLSGDEVQQIADSLVGAPEPYLDILRDAYTQ